MDATPVKRPPPIPRAAIPGQAPVMDELREEAPGSEPGLAPDHDEPEPARERRGPSTYLILLALGVATLGAIAFVFLDHRPLLLERDALRTERVRLRTYGASMHSRAREQRERGDELAGRLRATEAEAARLRAERDASRRTAAELAAERAAAEAQIAELRSAQDQLQGRLQREISRGEI
ncbi:MAG: hypothetical protein IT378_25210, partial [Sandaracinaceae bacterium]|nr:hypothetical protein [Sandaracinaceae bacterium]